MFRPLIVALLLHALPVAGQELPPVTNFPVEEFQAGSQTWALAQDEDGFIYAANNEGLLEFNGTRWYRYPSPNESVLRSVHCADGRVYTGSYMTFGYWERQAEGRLTYTRLSDRVTDQLVADEQFWNILSFRGLLVFQSLQQLFLYRVATGELTRLRPPGGLLKSFLIDDDLFFTGNDGGIYRVAEGTILPIAMPRPRAGGIVHLWKAGGRLYAQTATAGTLVVEGDRLTATDRFDFLAGRRVYSVISLEDGGLAFGTVSSGVYLTGPGGRLRYHLDRINGLTNNTVLSLFQDRDRNVWVGSDNGLNCIHLSSPLRSYTDRSGRIGTVYAAALHAGRLYLGSNQGLFVREGNRFRAIPGMEGQVWSLFSYGGTLFCGHDAGTYLITDEGVRPLRTGTGTWTFAPAPDRPDLIIVGGYRGLSMLQQTADGVWQFRNVVDGFSLSARHLALLSGPEAYLSHEYRGVYGLQLDADYRRVTKARQYASPAKGAHSGLARFRDSVYYYSREGVYVLQNWKSGFDRRTGLSETLAAEKYLSGKMTATPHRLWMIASDGPAYLEPGLLDDGLTVRHIPIQSELIGAPLGYENITAIGQDSFLIGTADGYLLLDTEAELPGAPRLHLTEVWARPGEGGGTTLPLDEEVTVRYTHHNFGFRLTVPNYSRFFHPSYRYRLGDGEWSKWQDRDQITFSQLDYGTYRFEAQAMLAGVMSEEPVSYTFTVARPWYLSLPMFLLYVVGTVGLVYLLHRSYTRYYRGKQRRWQEEQERTMAARERQAELELTRLNNQRLREDIAAKNREAALSTMNLVKKNELLQQIKQDLLTGEDSRGNIRQVVETIDRNIDEAETWNLFKDAFENADRDFFKKIKERHPELTPNDLKVCAYLRLNLSSKEIASLLNISPRSVEVKRYRLRKRMGLERETNLVDYILGI
jgi:DNA-binding CsgD family transcriptional regulator